MSAAMISASRLRKSALPTSCARRKISICATLVPRKLTSAVSFIIAMNSFPVGGMITRRACGRMTRRIFVAVRHPEHLGGLRLPVPDGLDARAKDLGHVRPVVETEREHPGRDDVECQEIRPGVAESDSDLGKRQVDEEELNDERSAAEERRIEAADADGDRVSLSRPSAPRSARVQARRIERMAMMIVHVMPFAMNAACSRIHAVSKPAAAKSPTSSARMTAQTTPRA